jgi:hypothetical protein
MCGPRFSTTPAARTASYGGTWNYSISGEGKLGLFLDEPALTDPTVTIRAAGSLAGVSPETAKRDWKLVRAWLYTQLVGRREPGR